MAGLPTELTSQEIAKHLDTTLLKQLEVRRYGDKEKKRAQKRGKKVPAGASYTAPMDEDSNEEKGSDEEKGSEEEKGSDEENKESSDEDLPDPQPASGNSGALVVALYEGEWFLAEVVRQQSEVPDGYTKLNYAAIRGANHFAWPDMADVMVTLNEDILLKNVTTEVLNSRGYFGLISSDLKKLNQILVVVHSCSFFYSAIFKIIAKLEISGSNFFPMRIQILDQKEIMNADPDPHWKKVGSSPDTAFFQC